MESQKENEENELSLDGNDRIRPVHRILAVLYIVLTNVFAWWFTYNKLNGIVILLTGWSHTVAFVFSAVLFISSVAAIAFYLIVAEFIVKKIETFTDLMFYSYILARNSTIFLSCFLSFAYLGWETKIRWPNAFTGHAASDFKSWILFSFLMLVKIIDADVLDLYTVKMPDIQPIDFFSRSLIAFFHFYLKFVLYALLLRLIKLLFK